MCVAICAYLTLAMCASGGSRDPAHISYLYGCQAGTGTAALRPNFSRAILAVEVSSGGRRRAPHAMERVYLSVLVAELMAERGLPREACQLVPSSRDSGRRPPRPTLLQTKIWCVTISSHGEGRATIAPPSVSTLTFLCISQGSSGCAVSRQHHVHCSMILMARNMRVLRHRSNGLPSPCQITFYDLARWPSHSISRQQRVQTRHSRLGASPSPHMTSD